MIEEGLNLAVTDLVPVEFDTKGKYRIKLTILVNVYNSSHHRTSLA